VGLILSVSVAMGCQMFLCAGWVNVGFYLRLKTHDFLELAFGGVFFIDLGRSDGDRGTVLTRA
jgi:hypothetical protein